MRFFRVIGAIVLVGLLLALGVGVYQAGVVAGAAGNGATAAAAPYWYGPGAWFGPWFGFGFGLFHLFGFLLFILLIVALVRLVFWGGRRHRGWGAGYGPGPGGELGWHGPNGPRGPMGPGGDWEQRMREYHDRLHTSGASTSSGTGADTGAGQADGAGTSAGPTGPGPTGSGPTGA